jgi:hypothetical protein
MPVVDLKKCTLKIKDGTSTTPQEVSVKIGQGNLTYTVARNIEYILDRGNLSSVREGDQIPCDVKFEFEWSYITTKAGDPAPSIEDALRKTGLAVSWISSDTDACNPYAVDLEFTFAPTPISCGDKEVILFSDFRFENLEHDAKGGQISCSGKCNIVAPTATKTSQTT